MNLLQVCSAKLPECEGCLHGEGACYDLKFGPHLQVPVWRVVLSPKIFEEGGNYMSHLSDLIQKHLLDDVDTPVNFGKKPTGSYFLSNL